MSIDHEWVVDDIIPSEEVHLICGPSGAGKTTWLMQWLKQWHKGEVESFFGHKVNPQPFCYVSVERRQRAVQRKLKRLGIDPETFPWIASSISNRLSSLDKVISEARRKYPDTTVLFIDGFAYFAPGPKPGKTEYKVVGEFLINCGHICEEKGLTIFAIVHSPKMKADEMYTNPRQRVLGSVSWGAIVDCIMILEPQITETKQVTPLRNFLLLPREAPDEIYEMTFETGRLELIKEDTLQAVMDAWLRDQVADDWEFMKSDAIDFGEDRGYCKRSVERWLEVRCKDGVIQAETRGRNASYRKCKPQ
jgi:hypothetical protein